MRDGWRELDRILRGEATRPAGLARGTIDVRAGRLAAVLVVLAMAYGACMGCYASLRGGGPSLGQLVASTVKVPALVFLTLAVTLPSLYVSAALAGSRLAPATVVRLMAAMLAVIVAPLASLGPIVAFFSASTTSYPFMVLLNVAAFAVAGACGAGFLIRTLHRLGLARDLPAATEAEEHVGDEKAGAPTPGVLDPAGDEPPSRHVRLVFRCWAILFGLVGAQMAWVLRPFIGNPARPFAWFRPREFNVFEAIWQTVLGLVS